MKSKITFYIGMIVLILSIVQYVASLEPIRFVGIGIGAFLTLWGFKVGWTKNRNLTVLLGHIAVTTGCLVVAYGIYQIPFLTKAPTLLEVIDLPLFWGIFTLWGGYCMITHGYCNCAIKMHEVNNKLEKSI